VFDARPLILCFLIVVIKVFKINQGHTLYVGLLIESLKAFKACREFVELAALSVRVRRLRG